MLQPSPKRPKGPSLTMHGSQCRSRHQQISYCALRAQSPPGWQRHAPLPAPLRAPYVSLAVRSYWRKNMGKTETLVTRVDALRRLWSCLLLLWCPQPEGSSCQQWRHRCSHPANSEAVSPPVGACGGGRCCTSTWLRLRRPLRSRGGLPPGTQSCAVLGSARRNRLLPKELTTQAAVVPEVASRYVDNRVGLEIGGEESAMALAP